MHFRRWAILFLSLAGPISAANDGPFDPSTILTRDQAKVWDKTHKSVGFSLLASFEYPPAMPWEKETPPVDVPPEVAALDGKKIAVQGYMVPLESDARGVTAFALTPSLDLCHFGQVGAPNEWIYIKMKKKTQWSGYMLITAYGTFDHGDKNKAGAPASFYRMDGDAITFSGK